MFFVASFISPFFVSYHDFSLQAIGLVFGGQVKRIKLGIRYNNDELNYDGKSIDTVDLADDAQYINNATYINSETGEDEAATGHAYHGVLYQEILKNPLHLDYEKIYIKVNGNESSEDEILEGEKTAETLYSLRGLLSVI